MRSSEGEDGTCPGPCRARGVAAGAAAAVAAVVFAASLDRLVTTPERYGWNWDASVAGPEIEASELVASPDVAELSVTRSTNIEIVGTRWTHSVSAHSRARSS